MSLEPLMGKLFVKPLGLDDEKTSKGGIILTADPKIYIEGIIEAVGPGVFAPDGKRVDPEVKVGDKIIYPHLNSQKIEYYGEDIYQISERDVVAVDHTWTETEKVYNEAIEEFRKSKEKK
jgi:chaperonin GroES